LLLHLKKLETHFLDTAVQLPNLFFKLLYANGFTALLYTHNRSLRRRLGIDCASAPARWPGPQQTSSTPLPATAPSAAIIGPTT